MMTKKNNSGAFGFIFQTIEELVPEDHKELKSLFLKIIKLDCMIKLLIGLLYIL